MVVSRGGGNKEWLPDRYSIFFGNKEKVLKLNGGGGYKNVNILNVTKLYSSQWLILCCVNVTSIFFFKQSTI